MLFVEIVMNAISVTTRLNNFSLESARGAGAQNQIFRTLGEPVRSQVTVDWWVLLINLWPAHQQFQLARRREVSALVLTPVEKGKSEVEMPWSLVG